MIDVRWLALSALAVVALDPAPAAACSCMAITRSQALRAADVAFRGRVIEIEPRRSCPARAPQPPPPPPAGEACVYGRVADPIGCVSAAVVTIERVEQAMPLGLHARLPDQRPQVALVTATADPQGGYARCGLAPGRYFLHVRSRHLDDASIIDVGTVAELGDRAAASVDVSTTERVPVERAKLRVLEPYKDADPPIDRWVAYGTEGSMCGFGAMWEGEIYEVYARRHGDELTVGLCGGTTRESTGTGIPGVRGRRGCGGCGTAGEGGGAILVLALLGWRVRSRRPSRGRGDGTRRVARRRRRDRPRRA